MTDFPLKDLPATAPPVTDLPIEAVLPDLLAALESGANAVLIAPPGAGKTTRAPLALLAAAWRGHGRIIVLEPRRLAARAAADRMAALLGEATGDTVGLRVRMETRTSARTRIEVVTEGVFTRMILDDPELDGIAAVLFDECHERSLEGDFGLALALETQSALRPDLRLVAMSATLDGARFAGLMGNAPVIESQGRLFPVETRYRGRTPDAPLAQETARAVRAALASETGSLLVFLPGVGDILRTADLLASDLTGSGVIIAPLAGALDARAQEQAIAPAPPDRRKVVLATSIAQTSLTIEGVRVVIDCGLARRARYDPATGLTRLVTERASRASVEQRRGRAGRLGPGVCIRLWDEPQTRALPAFDPPEILETDLTGLALDLARWGAGPDTLRWLDPPPRATFQEAQRLLQTLRALDADWRITAFGRELARLPLAPRLAAMIAAGAARGAGDLAAEIAVLVSEQGLGGPSPDLDVRRSVWRHDRSARARDARRQADRLARMSPHGGGTAASLSPGAVLALGYPERIAQARPGRPGDYLMASGQGAALDPGEGLARAPFLAVADVAGAAQRSRIRLAAALSPGEIETLFADRIETVQEIRYDEATRAVKARRQRRLGALLLSDAPAADADRAAIAETLLAAVCARSLDLLPWPESALALRRRAAFLQAREPDAGWPDLSDTALLATATHWLAPALHGVQRLDDIPPDTLTAALRSLFDWEALRRMDTLAPATFETPAGTRTAIDYSDVNQPCVAVRVQELFGLDHHPTILNGRVALALHLLSPARRPVQITLDLPGFWRGSYREVRVEMRGRYPKHPWPDDPVSAAPTLRAKPRGS
jgi:ATP-dependent helicase HrpB